MLSSAGCTSIIAPASPVILLLVVSSLQPSDSPTHSCFSQTMMHAPLSVTTSQGMFSMCSTACHPSAVASLDPPPPSLPPSRARTHTRTTHTHTHTNMAASVSPLRSSFRICSPLTLHHHCCRAKLRTHSRKCESQRRHLHQTATR